MSNKANHTLIGIFIAVALALAVAGIILFGSSRYFTRTSEYITYFDTSLTGLDAGAPVRFRGVTIGSVKKVLIHHNQRPDDPALPVILEIDEEALNEKSDVPFMTDGRDRIEESIEDGLRARLETQSLLTGLLFVNLEYLPGTPVVYHQVKPARTEIPSAPNQIQVFIEDFAQIADRMNAVLAKLDTSLGDLQTKELNRGLTNLLASLNSLTASASLTNTLNSAHQTLEELRTVLHDLGPQLEQLTASAELTLEESREAVSAVRAGVQDLRDVVAPRGPVRRELTTALEAVSEAARSVAALADFLNQHPNALISGRRTPEPRP